MIKKTIVAVVAAIMLGACGDRQASEPASSPAPRAAAAEPAAAKEGPEPAAAPPPPAPPVATLADSVSWPATTLRAKIVTSKGDMLVELYPKEAPKTVANFVRYAKDGHYDRLIIHRVVPGFVIQGGGYNKYWNERATREPVPYEGDNGLKNYRTTLAMARSTSPDSATSQWFINLRDNNEKLDHFVNDLGPRYGYTVFGRVIEGLDVADLIGAMRTGAGGPFPSEVPVETLTISRVDIIGDSQ
jgi:peptidyl-prolyl cis-trans isomerase A (cyclophilin A)/peptidyl-prolyl cis-trans isomerase B (cyclophilin B)